MFRTETLLSFIIRLFKHILLGKLEANSNPNYCYEQQRSNEQVKAS